MVDSAVPGALVRVFCRSLRVPVHDRTVRVGGPANQPGGPMTNRAAAILTIAVLRSADAVRARLNDERGQGTVEYVGLILLVAGVLAAVVVWATSKAGFQGIGRKVTDQLRSAIDRTAAGAHK